MTSCTEWLYSKPPFSCSCSTKTPPLPSLTKARVDYLIERLSDAGEKIVIPTPALSQCLVHADAAGPDYLAILGKQSCFRIAPFDIKAAIEAAIRTRQARQRGQPKGGDPAQPKAKIKFDRQIVAVAASEGASAVYSDDAALRGYAIEAGMEAFQLSDLPLPPEDPQAALSFPQSGG